MSESADSRKSVKIMGMRRATVNIPEDLERAMESYREGLDSPPSLADLMRFALAEYLSQRGYDAGDPSSSRPTIMENAPRNKGTKLISDMVIEDRR